MKPISGIVGLVLILVAVSIVVLSTSEKSYKSKNSEMVSKYVAQSKEALDDNDISKAIRLAKLAIAVDPKNKIGFKAYEDAVNTKYTPSIQQGGQEVKKRVAPACDTAVPDMGC
jgi:hypothetical protein